MLGFDIETTGLIAAIPESEISVVCLIDSETEVETALFFIREDAEGKQKLRERLLDALDEAAMLCAYNAVLFDIPFIVKQLGVEPERVKGWLLKLFDPFHAMRTAFHTTCKLDKMLALNGLECKSSTGLEAISMARNGEWERLENYCMDDVRLTVQLCQQGRLRLFERSAELYVCVEFVEGRVCFSLEKNVCEREEEERVRMELEERREAQARWKAWEEEIVGMAAEFW